MASSPDHNISESSRSSMSTYDYCSSPSQQVPELTNGLIELSCVDNGNMPYLIINEQPQNYFRFRYVSEMVGTHGCLLGISSNNNKMKTHPSVELKNYKGCAVITCQLVQHKNEDDHPHKLFVEEQEENSDVSYTVPERGSYKIAFAGMGIIHTAKKDVPDLLFRKHMKKYKLSNINAKEIHARCEAIAKTIDLNIVRLKFSAYDAVTRKEICDPVFSEPIHNMKSASTNDLKICRISKAVGSPGGGDDVFIFVEKVNKKNIQVWFYEEDADDKICWEAQAVFMQSDVHHQYGIAFRTPPYKDKHIQKNVTVYMKLVRPSDGRSSEPKPFSYKADPMSSISTRNNNKKRKRNSTHSSLTSSSGSGSINSITDVPTTVLNAEQIPEVKIEAEATFQILPTVGFNTPTQCDLGDAFMKSEVPDNANRMWCVSPEIATVAVPPAPTPLPNLQIDSTELDQLLQGSLPFENQSEFMEYLSSLEPAEFKELTEMNHMRYLQLLQTDSPRFQGGLSTTLKTDAKNAATPQKSQQTSRSSEKREADGYTAFYKSNDGYEVKKLVNDLYEIMSNKGKHTKKDVKSKLEKLFNIRLSNGDTFLHMTLCSNQPSFKNIVKIIHSVNMSHLLDYFNNKGQTVLHVAIAHNMHKMVPLLIANGSNPMKKDQEGDTAVHYAVRSESCLKPLLQAIRQYNVPCDLDVYNDERQTALHLCTSGASVRLLLEYGASPAVFDSQERLPLHIAAYDDNLSVMEALLDSAAPSDVDVLDGGGNTALQIVCDGPERANAIAMVKLLLQKKADPLKQSNNTESAWSRARDKPAIREIMKLHVPLTVYEDDVKSEPEDDIKSEPDDDYESADEGEWSPFEYELSEALDQSGGWRKLAAHLQLEQYAWYNAQRSATRTLLKHIKECRELSSKSLALILQDIGEVEAANIIKRYTN